MRGYRGCGSWLGVLVLVVLALVLAAACPSSRGVGLRALGDALLHQDEVENLDTLALFTGGEPGVLLEAVDLWRQFPDCVVILFDVASGSLRDEFARRGVEVPTEGRLSRDLLVQLGVPPDRIRLLKVDMGGTLFESRALAAHLTTTPARAPAVLVSWHHSGRVRRVLDRVFDGGVVPAVRIPKRDLFRPDDWWQRRDSLRIGLVELQKLLFDLTAHPFS